MQRSAVLRDLEAHAHLAVPVRRHWAAAGVAVADPKVIPPLTFAGSGVAAGRTRAIGIGGADHDPAAVSRDPQRAEERVALLMRAAPATSLIRVEGPEHQPLPSQQSIVELERQLMLSCASVGVGTVAAACNCRPSDCPVLLRAFCGLCQAKGNLTLSLLLLQQPSCCIGQTPPHGSFQSRVLFGPAATWSVTRQPLALTIGVGRTMPPMKLTPGMPLGSLACTSLASGRSAGDHSDASNGSQYRPYLPVACNLVV